MYTLVFMQAHIRFGIGIVPWCEFREDMNEHVMINCCDVAKCCKIPPRDIDLKNIKSGWRFRQTSMLGIVGVQRY